MDTRWTFRDRSRTTKSPHGAGWAGSSAPIGHGASKPAGVVRVPRAMIEGWETERFGAGDSIEARLREKPWGGGRERPYRRPTRVAGCESTEVDG
jgi:hypothetical protein